MKYIAKRYFNEYLPGQEVKEPKQSWIDGELVIVVQEHKEFIESIEIEELNPERPKRKKV